MTPVPARPDSDGPAGQGRPQGPAVVRPARRRLLPRLLPGPRDRDGLPESLRFWKTRIEATDPTQTFRVGLIYGPSGCGKSSLVKAGLLPRLAKSVLPVYVEATAEETEARLLRGLRKVCPDLPADRDLVEAAGRAAARDGSCARARRSCWSSTSSSNGCFARRGEEDTGAGRRPAAVRRRARPGHRHGARRLLDGRRPGSCSDLEIRLVEGENSAAGRPLRPAPRPQGARGLRPGLRRLPEKTGRLTRDQETVPRPGRRGPGPGRQGRSRCGWPCLPRWSRASPGRRRPCGRSAARRGSASRSSKRPSAPRPRLPSTASTRRPPRPCSKALLPETGTDIKGQMRSEAELREASGYAARPRDFDDLIRILDHELRLITPTDPEGMTDDGGRMSRRSGRPTILLSLIPTHLILILHPSVLPAHPRLPGPLAPRLADPQAAGDPPGPGRAAAGRTGGALERQAREPPPALGPGVGEHPAADQEARLDRAAAADDAAGGSGARPEGTGTGDPDRPGDLGRDRGLRDPAGRRRWSSR